MNFVGKWMEVDDMILSKVIQTQKNILAIKYRIKYMLQSTDPKKPNSKEAPREDS